MKRQGHSSTARKVLGRIGAEPKRSLSQNFLVVQGPVRVLLEAAHITNKDVVVEVGAGTGIITQNVVKKANKVIALEKDEKLAQDLSHRVSSPNLEVLAQDALKWNPPARAYKVVGNLPYAVSSPIIRRFLEADNPPVSITVMVQLEVAKRIVARPPRTNLLANSIQFYASVQFVALVKKTAFWPRPRVDSGILHITGIHKRTPEETKAFFRVLKAGFSQPRKQLINNISSGLNIERKEAGRWLKENGIDPTRRAQTLSLEEWMKLARALKSG